MKENYNFEYSKNNQQRMQFSVIKGASYRYLWHEELELMLVLSGEIEYFAGGERYPLHRGDMLFFNQNCGHSIISRKSGNRTISLKLHPQVLHEWGTYISMARPCFYVTAQQSCSKEDIQLLRKNIAEIYFYLREEDPILDKAAETLASLVFVHILHRHGLLRQYEQTGQKISNKNERIAAVNQYIIQHLTEPITLQDIADAAGYNKSYLSGQFKQWTGFHLSDYVKQMRIQRAIGMLEEKKNTLTEIALESGFSDYNTFTACMVQYCGRKPQEYRNSIGKDKKELEMQRHYAKFPDDYIEKCFRSLKTGNMVHEKDLDRNAGEIAGHAKAILDLLKANGRMR